MFFSLFLSERYKQTTTQWAVHPQCFCNHSAIIKKKSPVTLVNSHMLDALEDMQKIAKNSEQIFMFEHFSFFYFFDGCRIRLGGTTYFRFLIDRVMHH